MRIRIPVLLPVLLWYGMQAVQAQTCPSAEIAKVTDEAGQARKALNTFAISQMDPDVPAAASAAIIVFKDRLGALSSAYMRCAPVAASANTIAADLSRLLHVSTVDEPVRYGEAAGVMVERRRQAMVIHTTFNIPCAYDEVVGIFVPQRGTWHEAMRLQSGPYKDVSGAIGGTVIDISPSDAAGRWFVVSRSIALWCSSTWSVIRYAIARPAADPLKPKILLSRTDPIWWGGDDYGRARIGAGDVDLRFHAESIDPGVHNREWVRHFSVIGDKVLRIAPYANTPRDFAEEWLQSDWREAGPWTPRKDLKALHDKLHKQLSFDYAAVRACRGGDTQIELIDTYGGKSDDNGPHIFLRVRETMQMRAVSGKADSDCKGFNQLQL